MKKIFLSTIVLLAFTISIILFEIGCKKSADAQSPNYVLTPATTTKLGGVIPDGTTIAVDPTGKISTITSNAIQNKILYKDYANGSGTETLNIANSDGSNPQKIPIVLPSGLAIGDNAMMSADRKSVVFDVYTISSSTPAYIYACNVDGSNLHKVVTSNNSSITIMGAF
jgi:hypothetical protein